MTLKNNRQEFFCLTDPGPFPEQLHRLLQEASVFYHVPYCYLVPDSGMIREDEIRFFKVDHNWVTALLDGICSLGRNASIDYAHDSKWIWEEYKEALRTSREVRESLLGKTLSKETADSGKEPEEITGFLLNSTVAEHYRGLEFKAFDQKEEGNRLTALRIDRLGSRMLLGLFRGRLLRLEICQPPEGLHYGCASDDKGLVKKLRSLETGKLFPDQRIEICLKTKGAQRVFDVQAAARKMQSSLGLTEITSAEIAAEMIQNAQSAVFTLIREEEL